MDAAKIVNVTWLDAHAEVAKAVSTEEAVSLKPMVCDTVGFIISKDDDVVVVASEHSDDEEAPWRDVVCIPRGMITQIKYLT